MRKHVAAANRETAPVLEEASSLINQKREAETRKDLLDAFNKHFLIDDGGLARLTIASDRVDDEFFATLRRVKQVHADCQVLLGNENQQLGLELMEQSSRNLNNAYQKLYRWIQKEFRALDLETPQIKSSMRRALRVLAERPTLFQNCLDIFAEARERILSDSFYSALTGSSFDTGEDAGPKPIDFFAHDPLRYVGDMLAWAHSTTVSEREALEGLFSSAGDEITKGIQVGLDSEPWLRADQEDGEIFNGRKTLEHLVNRDLAGVAKALRQRVEQVIQSHDDSVLAYKIANLMDFYSVTFARLLSTESTILGTLSDLANSALRRFESTMQDLASSIRTDASHTPADLGIPEFLDEAIGRLKTLMKTYDSSLTPIPSREAGFVPILREALDPFLSSCKELSKDLQEPSDSIFAINCLLMARDALSIYDFTAGRLSGIDETMRELASRLVEYQHAFFLHTSGLHPMIVALSPLSDSEEDVSRIPELEPFQQQPLKDTSQILNDFLPTALVDAMENLKYIKSSRLAEEVTTEAANNYFEDFEFVESRLAAADALQVANGTDNEHEDQEEEEAPMFLRHLFPRTSGEIRVLLS